MYTKTTTETTHTPEPWYDSSTGNHQGLVLSEGDGQSVAVTYQGPADAARIVACVNACKGLNPEAVPEMLAALESFTRGIDSAEERGETFVNLNRLNFHRRRFRAAIAKAKDPTS